MKLEIRGNLKMRQILNHQRVWWQNRERTEALHTCSDFIIETSARLPVRAAMPSAPPSSWLQTSHTVPRETYLLRTFGAFFSSDSLFTPCLGQENLHCTSRYSTRLDLHLYPRPRLRLLRHHIPQSFHRHGT